MKKNQRSCEDRSLKDYFQRAEGNLVGRLNIISTKRMRREKGDIREPTKEQGQNFDIIKIHSWLDRTFI